ncbi:MAG: HNH endonuclease [candidate division Zixibacteria bacterium]|nr:HNH endonuclease [candidate division Zixibacteria bacterium]
MRGHVLILNQNYEPLCVCTARRAVVLVMLGKAEVIDTYPDPVHTVREPIPLPCIVRLNNFVKVPQNGILLSRKNVLKRDGHQCQYCGTTKGPLTVDHVIPRNRGGEDSWENLVCACQKCNNHKGDRSLEYADMALLRKPKAPTRIHFIRDFIGVGHQSWRPYLFLKI